jgi:hypothetical protein
MAPALARISCALPSYQEDLPDASRTADTQLHFIQAAEARWRANQLTAVKVHAGGLAPGVWRLTELLRTHGMDLSVFASRRALLEDAVPAELAIDSY